MPPPLRQRDRGHDAGKQGGDGHRQRRPRSSRRWSGREAWLGFFHDGHGWGFRRGGVPGSRVAYAAGVVVAPVRAKVEGALRHRLTANLLIPGLVWLPARQVHRAYAPPVDVVPVRPAQFGPVGHSYLWMGPQLLVHLEVLRAAGVGIATNQIEGTPGEHGASVGQAHRMLAMQAL